MKHKALDRREKETGTSKYVKKVISIKTLQTKYGVVKYNSMVSSLEKIATDVGVEIYARRNKRVAQRREKFNFKIIIIISQ